MGTSQNKSADNSSRLEAPGPRTVRAWFDTVINPVLEGLKIQGSYLEVQNWTWRYRSSECESIVPALSYVDPAYIANYDYLATWYPDIQNLLDRHRDLIAQLNNACDTLQSGLQQSKELSELYDRHTNPQALESSEATLSGVLGGGSREDHLAYLAELIINHTKELPPYYIVHPIWNPARAEFIGILDNADLAPLEKSVQQAGFTVNSFNTVLGKRLTELRRDLALEVDEPPVAPRGHQGASGFQGSSGTYDL